MYKYRFMKIGAILAAIVILASACGGDDSEDNATSNGGNGQASGEPYEIGISGLLSGPGSSFYLAQAEGIRVYFDRLNDNGGIDGHPVEVEARDNGADPATTAADAQVFADSGVLVATLTATSNTVPGWAEQLVASGVPSVNMGPCYGPSVPGGGETIAENYFCVGVTGVADSYALIESYNQIVQETSIDPKPAYASSDAPGNLSVFQYLITPLLERDSGVAKGGYLASMPFATTDYGPIARAVIDSGANSGVFYSITEQIIPLVKALRASGSEIPVTTIGLDSLTKYEALNDPNLTVLVHGSYLGEGKPIHEVIAEAAEQYDAATPAEDMLDGWATAMAIEQGLRACGFPCDRETLIGILNDNFTMDSQDFVDLYGEPLTFTTDVHYSPVKNFKALRWDEDAGELVQVGDTFPIDDPGLVFPEL